MLHVLGAGSFFPATKISNSLLGELLGSDFVAALAASTGISTRYSSLPESYLRGTSDTSLKELRKLPGASPTDLAYSATLEACSRAGISPSQLSALSADCFTPFQETPAEAHLLVGKLKLKIPSCNLVSSK